MERMDPASQDERKDIPERVNEVLNPRSISPADMEADDYDGTESVEEYLQNRARRKNEPGAPPGQTP